MKSCFILLFLITTNLCFGQGGTWTWVAGSRLANSGSSFGVKGVPSANVTPPTVYEPLEWTDKQGNFWLFGGVDQTNSEFNAMMKFDYTSNHWTWMSGQNYANAPGVWGTKGVPSVNNCPKPRAWGAASWVDTSGNLWLFGGAASGKGTFSDVWRFNVKTYEWTWMSGDSAKNTPRNSGVLGVFSPTTTPGAMMESNACWVSGNRMYRYGGYDYKGFMFADIWCYDMTINQWALMRGPQQNGAPGHFGTLGVEDTANYPAARFAYAHWTDTQGNFWLFSGNEYSDMWRFNPANNRWTWMSGSNQRYSGGNYTGYCQPSTLAYPAYRGESRACCTDATGNFWLFGGGHNDCINDVWVYCPVNNKWTWVIGDTLVTGGNWGLIGVPAATNMPPGLMGSVAWMDPSGNMFIYGGLDPYKLRSYSTVWKLTPNAGCVNPCAVVVLAPKANYSVTPLTACAPACFTPLNNSLNATSYKWNFPGGTPSFSTAVNPTVCYTVPGKYNVELIATNAAGSDTLLQTNYITVLPPSQAGAVTLNGDSICQGSGATSVLSITGGAGNIQWQSSLNGVTFTNISGATSGTYTTSPALAQTTYFRALMQNAPCAPDSSNTVIVYVVPGPSANFTFSGTSLISFLSTTTGNVVFYSWDFGDGAFSNAVNPTHNYAVMDTYSVCLTVYNSSNCSYTVCQDVTAGLGVSINSPGHSAAFTVYPNPTGKQLTVSRNQLSPGSELILTDLLGRELKNISAAQKETVIDVSDLAASVYFLTLKTTEGSVTKKFVKE